MSCVRCFSFKFTIAETCGSFQLYYVFGGKHDKRHGFAVVAVSYHEGSSFQTGHWRTVIWQGPPSNRWLNYDDGKLPDSSVMLPSTVRSNWCMAWLASNPRFE